MDFIRKHKISHLLVVCQSCVVVAGIFFSSGHHWHTLRRFLLRNLRDLGMGKSYMDDVIQVEAEALVKHFKNFKGKPVPMSSVLNLAPLNVAWQLVTSG